MSRTRVIPKNVTLSAANLELLQTVQENEDLTSLSAALRYIIHDWHKMKVRETNNIIAGTPIRITEQPR